MKNINVLPTEKGTGSLAKSPNTKYYVVSDHNRGISDHIDYNIYITSDVEIKEIILEFKKQLPNITEDIKTKVEEIKYNFDHIEKEIKNKKNSLSKEYYENEILSKSLSDFTCIQSFLDDDKNSDLRDYYFDIASELSGLITLKRSNFNLFDEVFIFIYQKIADGNNELKGGKRHIFTLLHYMYMNCEIGLK
jgi:hypothetical protein